MFYASFASDEQMERLIRSRAISVKLADFQQQMVGIPPAAASFTAKRRFVQGNAGVPTLDC